MNHPSNMAHPSLPAVIAKMKKRELTLQCIILCVSLCLAPMTLCFSLFLMGITHAIGTLYWLDRRWNQAPRITARRVMSYINIAVIILFTACMIFGDDDIRWGAILAMMGIGAVICVSYIILTAVEIHFYERLAHGQHCTQTESYERL